MRKCDVLIIGAGPAGLTAAIYAARAKLSTVVLEKSKIGGQIVTTTEVANFPGCPEDSGPGIIEKMKKQVDLFGAEIIKEEVTALDLKGDLKVVKTSKSEFEAKTVIYAAGAYPRKLGVEGEKELTGGGVSYCATCDAGFFEELEVYVIGGGNSAVEEGMYLTKFARKVNLITIDPHLTAEKSICEEAMKNEKMTFTYNSVVTKIHGKEEGIVTGMTVKNVKTNEETTFEPDPEDGTFGIFPFIGYVPNTDLVKDILDNENSYIKTDDHMNTNIEGVYAAGDLRVKLVRQVVTAASDGAIAAVSAEKYIEEKFNK